MSHHIGDPLLFIQTDIANRVNEYLQFMATVDETGILQNIEVETGDEGLDAQSVYVRTKGTKKSGKKRAFMVILRISDHKDKQKKKTDVDTRTLRVDDVITWTLKGVEKGRWKDVSKTADRSKHMSNPDVIFMLGAEDAETKIRKGFEKIIKMLKRLFEENGIEIIL